MPNTAVGVEPALATGQASSAQGVRGGDDGVPLLGGRGREGGGAAPVVAVAGIGEDTRQSTARPAMEDAGDLDERRVGGVDPGTAAAAVDLDMDRECHAEGDTAFADRARRGRVVGQQAQPHAGAEQGGGAA